MKKSWLIILGTLFIAGLIAAGIGWNMFNKTHEDVLQLSPDYTLTASDLFEAFEKDESRANELYLGKIIEIEGIIGSIETPTEGKANLLIKASKNSFGGIICSFSNLDTKVLESLNKDQKIKIRGECSGFLMDVNLIRCVIAPF